MGRVSKAPITVPNDLEVKLDPTNSKIEIKSKKNSMTCDYKPNQVAVNFADGMISIEEKSETKAAKAFAGSIRNNLNNIVTGLSKGFTKKLILVGVGYRAKLAGKKLELTLGLSHPVNFEIPAGLEVSCPSNTEIIINGYDKHQVGQTAANIRAFRPPENYKGKGIRYENEKILLKETKKKK